MITVKTQCRCGAAGEASFTTRGDTRHFLDTLVLHVGPGDHRMTITLDGYAEPGALNRATLAAWMRGRGWVTSPEAAAEFGVHRTATRSLLESMVNDGLALRALRGGQGVGRRGYRYRLVGE